MLCRSSHARLFCFAERPEHAHRNAHLILSQFALLGAVGAAVHHHDVAEDRPVAHLELFRLLRVVKRAAVHKTDAVFIVIGQQVSLLGSFFGGWPRSENQYAFPSIVSCFSSDPSELMPALASPTLNPDHHEKSLAVAGLRVAK